MAAVASGSTMPFVIVGRLPFAAVLPRGGPAQQGGHFLELGPQGRPRSLSSV